MLLFDRRGEGESEGDFNAFGWGGDGGLSRQPADGKMYFSSSQRVTAVASTVGERCVP